MSKLSASGTQYFEDLLKLGSQLGGEPGEFFVTLTPWLMGFVVLYLIVQGLGKFGFIKLVHKELTTLPDPEEDSAVSKLISIKPKLVGNYIILIFMAIANIVYGILALLMIAIPFQHLLVGTDGNLFTSFVVGLALMIVCLYMIKNIQSYIQYTAKRILYLKTQLIQ